MPTACQDHLIELRRIVKTYDTPAGAFQRAQRRGPRGGWGEFVAVVGKSGSGKTTLLNVLPPSTGRPRERFVSAAWPCIELDEGQSAVWRGRNIGVVFQFFQLLPTLTVLENVMLPMDFCRTYPPCRRRERAMHLLDRSGHRASKPTSCRRALRGQQQRAAIARALANDPPIIVADEPTGNLDSHTAAIVFQLFRDLAAGGKTILVVTHERDVARYVTRLVRFWPTAEIVDQDRHLAESPRHGKGPAEVAHA